MLGTMSPAVAKIEDKTIVPLLSAFIPQSELSAKNAPEQDAIVRVVKSNPLKPFGVKTMATTANAVARIFDKAMYFVYGKIPSGKSIFTFFPNTLCTTRINIIEPR